MSVKITGTFTGNNKVTLVHGPSQTELITAPPADIGGDASSFSPTDLAGASLGSCIVTTMAMAATRDGIDLTGATFSVMKEMTSTPPRRIASLTVDLHLPRSVPESAREKLERIALKCPVHASLHPEVKIPLSFTYDK